MSHKQDQLNDIRNIERKLDEAYNGDLDLAYSMLKNSTSSWAPLISKDELDTLSKKDSIV